ncbi:MAG: hypothetical protein WCP19_09590 [Chloroflexota bacterium]
MLKNIGTMILILFLFTACSTQQPAPQTEPVVVIPTLTFVPDWPTATITPPTETAVPVPTATSAVTLFPTITIKEKVTCRLGPDKNYYAVVTMLPGQTSDVQGRTEDGEWLVIASNTPNKSPTCFVPTKTTDLSSNVNDLLVSHVLPLPDGPTYAYASGGVCGINRQGAILIQWGPTVSGTGYFVFRNGKNIAGVHDDHYIDHDTPGSKTPYTYTYTIVGFDSVGTSKLNASVSVEMCK